jgi:hypothetical protein
VFVLEVPEEHVSVVLGSDLNMSFYFVMSGRTVQAQSCLTRAQVRECVTYPACIFTRSPSGAPGRSWT